MGLPLPRSRGKGTKHSHPTMLVTREESAAQVAAAALLQSSEDQAQGSIAEKRQERLGHSQAPHADVQGQRGLGPHPKGTVDRLQLG